MRTGRGLLATFGASVSLIAAGSVALLVVSAVIAFNGWPRVGKDSEGTRTTALAMAAGVQADTARSAKPIRLAAVRKRPAPRPARAAAGTVATGKRTVARPDTSVVVPSAASSVGGTPETDAPAPPKPEEPEPAAGDPVREATGSLGDTTSDTTSTLGEAVNQVSPELGKSVGGIGQLLDDTLTDVGETVGGIVDPLGGE